MPRPEWSFLMLPEDHKEVKWMQSFAQAKLTVWGQIIFGMVLVGMAISAVGTQIAGYYFVSLVWALFLTAFFLTLFFRPQVVAMRILPPSPTAGGVTLYRVIVTNTGKTPLRNLEIFDHKLPFGLYSALEHPQQKTSVDWLGPGKSETFTIALRTPRRGSFLLEPLIAATSFPTGLIRSIRRVAQANPFIVFPKLLKLKDTPLLLKHKFQAGGTYSSLRFGNCNEFLSTREYREGDRMRDIHWQSSARSGKLIVKEYVDEHSVRVGLFLDTQLKRFEKHLSFEARISLCAGVAEDFYQKNYLIELYLSDARSPVVKIGAGYDQYNHLLEMLSAVEGEDQINFSHSLARIKEQAQGLSGLMLFLKDWDKSRQTFVQAIRELNVPLSVVIVRDKPLTLSVSDNDVVVYSPKQLDGNYKI